MAWDDEYDDEYDGEYDDEPDHDGVDLRPCPECGAMVYEESVACPECGELIDWSRSRRGGRPWEGRPGWSIALGIAGIIATCVVLALY